MPRPTPINGWTFRGTPVDVTTSDGTTVRGEEAGSGPAIVFSHCWACDRSIWEPVAARLVARHRVIVFDQRDHGRSDSSPTTTPLTIERLGTDLLELCDALDVDQPVVAGHSMGGMAALAAAMEDGERLGGLVLVATSAHPSGWPPGGTRLLRFLARVTGSSWLQRRLEGRFGRGFVRGSLGRRPHPQAVERTRSTFARTEPAVRRRYLEAIASFDRAGELGTISTPTDVIAGSLDTLLPRPHARQLGDRIPHGRVTQLPGAGHMLPLERADAVADLIESHIATRVAAPTERTPT